MSKKLGRFILTIVLFVFELIYFSIATWVLKKLGFNLATYNITTKLIIAILIFISFMLVIFAIYHKTLIEDFKDYKKNFKEYFKFGLKSWLVGLLLMVVSNIIIYRFYPNNSTNEVLVQETLQQLPIYMVFSAVIYAPFVEEIIYRKSIRDFIDNDYLYILVSGIAFGYIHTLANYTNALELLYIIPYGSVGAAFAYIYTKKKNILVPMTFHMLHNAIIVAISLINYFVVGTL